MLQSSLSPLLAKSNKWTPTTSILYTYYVDGRQLPEEVGQQGVALQEALWLQPE
jgi:hypothetical protein